MVEVAVIRHGCNGADPAVGVVEEACDEGRLQNLMIVKTGFPKLVHLLLVYLLGMGRHKPCILAEGVILIGDHPLAGTVIVAEPVYEGRVLPHAAKIVAVGGEAVGAAVDGRNNNTDHLFLSIGEVAGVIIKIRLQIQKSDILLRVERKHLEEVIDSLKDKFGTRVVSLNDEDALMEAVAETDEALMEKYFDGEEFTPEEFNNGLMTGIASGDICPIMTCSALKGEGIKEILDNFVKYAPKASGTVATEDGEEIAFGDGSTAAYVFKIIADPFLGKITVAKLIRGKLVPAQVVYNTHAEKEERLGSMFFLRGKTQAEAPQVLPGDIVAFAKLQYTQTGDTLCDKSAQVTFPRIDFAQPTLYTAIEPKAKGDDAKVAAGIAKLKEEDPSFSYERNSETKQSLLGTQGDIQTGIILQKLKDRYGADVNTVPQKVAYRETIKGNSDVQGKHKKQTGGSGQYGDVHIRFSPSEQDFEFEDVTVGGCVPKQFIPAVEKGLRECMEKGPLAGCKCQGIKAVLHYGSYHAVDSDEMSFKTAASLAFKKGIVEAKPCLLEPIMHVDITVPDDYVGAVMGDLPTRRGLVLGMDPVNGGQVLHAEVPQSEMFDYSVVLRAMTQARGSFTMSFERYSELPGMLADKVIAAYKAEQDEK